MAAAQEVNILDMSDEDVLNMAEPTEELNNDEQEEQKEVTSQKEEEVDDEGQNLSDEEPGEGQDEAQPDESSDAEDAKSDGSSHDAGTEGEGEADDQKEVATPEQLLEALFTPFKANGKEMNVSSIDDARTLMQMGANYNKKMQGLKPNLKLMKMLSKNELLDEEKLSYLIDLNSGNPDAIAKLLKDTGVDPMDLDTDKDTTYTPGTYNVSDKEVDLDMVLETIQDTPSFNETIDIISNKWDESSRKVVLDTPELIATINGHVASGVYAEVMTIVDNEQALGRLTELSDLEAYKHVGDVLQSQGVFNNQPQGANGVQPNANDNSKDPNLINRRRAAGSSKSSPKKKGGEAIYNPLELSDEDFMNAAAPM